MNSTITNPLTGRRVSKTGRVGRWLKKLFGSGKVRNPKTGRDVDATGRVGRQVLREEKGIERLPSDLKMMIGEYAPDPKFMDLTPIVYPKFRTIGYVRERDMDDVLDKAEKYIRSKSKRTRKKSAIRFHKGDVVFIGSDYRSRQGYGFFVVVDPEKGVIDTSESFGDYDDPDAVEETNVYIAKQLNPLGDYAKLSQDVVAFQRKYADRAIF